jgi:hypothetical protein
MTTNGVEVKTGRIALKTKEDTALDVDITTSAESELIYITINGIEIGNVYTNPQDGYMTVTVKATKIDHLTVHSDKRTVSEEEVLKDGTWHVRRFAKKATFNPNGYERTLGDLFG